VDVVRALVDADGPVHGWRIAELTNQSGPNVYRALRRLQDAAWLEYEWVDSPSPGRPRRRVYRLTSAGRKYALRLLADQPKPSPETTFEARP